MPHMGPHGIKGAIMKDAPMKKFTSMGVGGEAAFLCCPANEADLTRMVSWLRKKRLPLRFLGNGTNVIVAEGGLGMGVVRLTAMHGFRARRTSSGALVEAGGGASLKSVIGKCAVRGLSGLESLFGIPGTIGGALKMNAGSFGASISDCLVSVRVMNEAGKTARVGRREIEFGYRTSSFSDGECILKGTFALREADPGIIRAEMERVWKERLAKHPMDMPSAGSIFKNRNGEPCWRFIDRAGMRGFRIGNAAVSEKHPNFIVNLGGASAFEVKRLIETVKQRVAEATGVALEEEVELWGFHG